VSESDFAQGSLGFRLHKTEEHGGFVISDIVEGGQAEGLRYSEGDILLAVNGNNFRDGGIVNVVEVSRLLKETPRPARLRIKLSRSNKGDVCQRRLEMHHRRVQRWNYEVLALSTVLPVVVFF
jgi:C-terminal processing protease CtpA/Prc